MSPFMQVQPMRPPSIFELLDALDAEEPEEDPIHVIQQMESERRQPGMFNPPPPMILERNTINAKPQPPKPEYEIAQNNQSVNNVDQPQAALAQTDAASSMFSPMFLLVLGLLIAAIGYIWYSKQDKQQSKQSGMREREIGLSAFNKK